MDPKDVWTVILSIVASLIGGGAIVWITLPLVIKKSRAEIRQLDITTAETALNVANDATDQVKKAREDLEKERAAGASRDENNQKRISELQTQIQELQRMRFGPFILKSEKKIITYPTLMVLSETSTIEPAPVE